VDRGGDIVGGHIDWKGRDGLRAVRLFFFFLIWQREKMGRDRAWTEPVPPLESLTADTPILAPRRVGVWA
jgi:hypothetical protein